MLWVRNFRAQNYAPVFLRTLNEETSDSFLVILYRCSLIRTVQCIAYSLTNIMALRYHRVYLCIKKAFILLKYVTKF